MKIYQRQLLAVALLSAFSLAACGAEAAVQTEPSDTKEAIPPVIYGAAIYTESSVILPSTDGLQQWWQPLAWSAGEWRADLFGGELTLSGRGDWSTPLEVRAQKAETFDVLPWKLQLISAVFDFDIKAEGQKSIVEATIKYQPNNYYKQAFLYDESTKEWSALPSTDFPLEGVLRLALKPLRGKIAVFAQPPILTVGKASWYAYKPGLFTASPDFAKGSKLRVTNLDNGKIVEVEVNDWGPERDKHPDRVVDLSKEAFAAIADLGQGIIRVAVSPIQLAPDRNGRVLGVKAESLGSQPKLTAKAAVILNERNGEVILAKNPEQIVPIASLTKVVALSVYLREQSDLSKKITYSDKDLKFNTLYAPISEVAKISLKNGDIATAKDFVYAAAVASANNAVESLVRASGLSREAFVEKMNRLAADWGARNTRFVEPTGLSSKNVSTAEDYAIITREAFKHEVIKQASVTPKYTFKVANRQFSRVLSNTNQLVVDQAQANLKLEPLGINGSKTGFLNEAGYCLLTRVQGKTDQFTIVTFGAPTRQSSFNEMMDLIKYANLKS